MEVVETPHQVLNAPMQANAGFVPVSLDLDAKPHGSTSDWPVSEPFVIAQDTFVNVTPAKVEYIARQMDAATMKDGENDGESLSLKGILPPDAFSLILQKATAKLTWEPTLVELRGLGAETKVVVVGDTHGQYHDVRKMFHLVGPPSDRLVWVLNGDYVDRGAWGAEELAYLCLLKLAHPKHLYLLRGNHESSFCTTFYGFKSELQAKYGPRAAKDVYKHCRKLFTAMPLACLVEGAALVLHGGLFRKPPTAAGKGGSGAKKRPRASLNSTAASVFELGSLNDLRASAKGNQDPVSTSAKDRLASDVLWSDPILEPGLRFNEGREIGCVFGPDMTERFLRENGLRCVIRSHEGPDARANREDNMPNMLQGFTLDHDTPAGQLYTCFSAPDYPQFQSVPPEERYRNRAAVAVLTAPAWGTPHFWTFTEAPRPANVDAFYDFMDGAETGDDMMSHLPSASDASGMTGMTDASGGGEDPEEEGHGGSGGGPASEAQFEGPARAHRRHAYGQEDQPLGAGPGS